MENTKFKFIEDLMNPCNIGRCMNVNLRCLMYGWLIGMLVLSNERSN